MGHDIQQERGWALAWEGRALQGQKLRLVWLCGNSEGWLCREQAEQFPVMHSGSNEGEKVGVSRT